MNRTSKLNKSAMILHYKGKSNNLNTILTLPNIFKTSEIYKAK